MLLLLLCINSIFFRNNIIRRHLQFIISKLIQSINYSLLISRIWLIIGRFFLFKLLNFLLSLFSLSLSLLSSNLSFSLFLLLELHLFMFLFLIHISSLLVLVCMVSMIPLNTWIDRVIIIVWSLARLILSFNHVFKVLDHFLQLRIHLFNSEGWSKHIWLDAFDRVFLKFKRIDEFFF